MTITSSRLEQLFPWLNKQEAAHLSTGEIMHDTITELYEEMRKDEEEQATYTAYVEAAQEQHCRDGEIEVDEGAVVSIGGDPGAYVQAWIWVADEELRQDGDPDFDHLTREESDNWVAQAPDRAEGRRREILNEAYWAENEDRKDEEDGPCGGAATRAEAHEWVGKAGSTMDLMQRQRELDKHFPEEDEDDE